MTSLHIYSRSELLACRKQGEQRQVRRLRRSLNKWGYSLHKVKGKDFYVIYSAWDEIAFQEYFDKMVNLGELFCEKMENRFD